MVRPARAVVTALVISAFSAAPAYAASDDVPVGSTVCIVSSTDGEQCGTVVAEDVTVSFPDGTVNGLSQTDLCVTADDDGIDVVSGHTVVGHVLAREDYCGMLYIPTE